jgi:hypothetical protein
VTGGNHRLPPVKTVDTHGDLGRCSEMNTSKHRLPPAKTVPTVHRSPHPTRGRPPHRLPPARAAPRQSRMLPTGNNYSPRPHGRHDFKTATSPVIHLLSPPARSALCAPQLCKFILFTLPARTGGTLDDQRRGALLNQRRLTSPSRCPVDATEPRQARGPVRGSVRRCVARSAAHPKIFRAVTRRARPRRRG